MLISNVAVTKKCHWTCFTVSNLYKSKEDMLSTSENITTTKKKITKCDMGILIKHCWNGSRHRKIFSHEQPNFKGRQKNLQINYSTRIMHVKMAGLIILKSGITLFMPVRDKPSMWIKKWQVNGWKGFRWNANRLGWTKHADDSGPFYYDSWCNIYIQRQKMRWQKKT